MVIFSALDGAFSLLTAGDAGCASGFPPGTLACTTLGGLSDYFRSFTHLGRRGGGRSASRSLLTRREFLGGDQRQIVLHPGS